MTLSLNPPPPDPKFILKMLAEGEQRIGAPKDSLISLSTDNDWSLVIKAHALVESAVTALLATLLDPRLREGLSRLELGRPGCGKVELLKYLGKLSTHQRRFISFLSELRNQLAHDAAFLQFGFQSYLATLNPAQKKKFFEAMALATEGENKAAWLALLDKNPQAGILMCTISVVMICTIEAQGHAQQLKATDIYARLGKAMSEMETEQAAVEATLPEVTSES
ncbi:MAG TPA: hypothetical protein VJN96_19700 [Vicinamibacterales bacterium]|nr:hypothetical protein [Vicinamibacterales bacterium]